jgi:predicted DCC family thiol-disulfide oxidoreductase YuxK
MNTVPINKSIILFDGVCNLCNSSVNFIIKRDKRDYFRFAAIQSDIGDELCKKYNIASQGLESVILIEGGKVYNKSTAALRIARKLSGLWPLLYLFIVFPLFIRDNIYIFIANNRYKWFGKKEFCMVPTPEIKSKFITYS